MTIYKKRARELRYKEPLSNADLQRHDKAQTHARAKTTTLKIYFSLRATTALSRCLQKRSLMWLLNEERHNAPGAQKLRFETVAGLASKSPQRFSKIPNWFGTTNTHCTSSNLLHII
mmetsp:Transcript_29553/g.76732  ORF Transcript_29553/g.76732 Transcript_29553/m.76732 type:complete len:117 (-) Transcript_29553:6-356(-)